MQLFIHQAANSQPVQFCQSVMYAGASMGRGISRGIKIVGATRMIKALLLFTCLRVIPLITIFKECGFNEVAVLTLMLFTANDIPSCMN